MTTFSKRSMAIVEDVSVIQQCCDYTGEILPSYILSQMRAGCRFIYSVSYNICSLCNENNWPESVTLSILLCGNSLSLQILAPKCSAAKPQGILDRIMDFLRGRPLEISFFTVSKPLPVNFPVSLAEPTIINWILLDHLNHFCRFSTDKEEICCHASLVTCRMHVVEERPRHCPTFLEILPLTFWSEDLNADFSRK